MAQDTFGGSERRREPRIELTGAALIALRNGSRMAFTAVLDNVNRLGAGFHTKEPVNINEALTVTLVFLNQQGQEEKEHFSGRVAWARPYEKGFLIGVMWDQAVTAHTHSRLTAYLNDSLNQVG